MMADTKCEEAVETTHQGTVDGTKIVLGATEEEVLLDEEESKVIVRKFDIRLLALFTVINLFSFIDRVNIGNARLLGLEKDLRLTGLKFNIALTCLFVSYCVVELPSNILCKLIGGHIYIPALVLCFGIITMLTALVEHKGSLYACRFLLGVVEGGISPGLIFMLALL
jgi:MFS family permease